VYAVNWYSYSSLDRHACNTVFLTLVFNVFAIVFPFVPKEWFPAVHAHNRLCWQPGWVWQS